MLLAQYSRVVVVTPKLKGEITDGHILRSVVTNDDVWVINRYRDYRCYFSYKKEITHPARPWF